MNNLHSDAFVFFGATGDLAYKKIFPSLHAMVKRGNLNVPVIGVAKAGWTLDQLRARAADSVEKHGGVDRAAFEKLSGLLRYVDGDYQRPGHVPRHPAGTRRRRAPGPLSGDSASALRTGGGATRQGRRGKWRARHRGEAVRHGSCLGASAESNPAGGLSTRASIFRIDHYLGKRPVNSMFYSAVRKLVSRAAPEPHPRRETCRSRWRRISEFRAAGLFTTRPARSATWCRTICFRCSRTWRWSRRSGRTASPSGTRR